MAICVLEKRTWAVAMLLSAVAVPWAALAQQTTIEISTTAAPAAPRIQPPFTVSAFSCPPR